MSHFLITFPGFIAYKTYNARSPPMSFKVGDGRSTHTHTHQSCRHHCNPLSPIAVDNKSSGHHLRKQLQCPSCCAAASRGKMRRGGLCNLSGHSHGSDGQSPILLANARGQLRRFHDLVQPHSGTDPTTGLQMPNCASLVTCLGEGANRQHQTACTTLSITPPHITHVFGASPICPS